MMRPQSMVEFDEQFQLKNSEQATFSKFLVKSKGMRAPTGRARLRSRFRSINAHDEQKCLMQHALLLAPHECCTARACVVAGVRHVLMCLRGHFVQGVREGATW